MRKMRRKDKRIAADEAIKLLADCEYGVLSTVDSDGQPYGLPLNFVYKDDCIYFHCALTGHKIDNIAKNSRVSFCVVGDTKVLPADFMAEGKEFIKKEDNATKVIKFEIEHISGKKSPAKT